MKNFVIALFFTFYCVLALVLSILALTISTALTKAHASENSDRYFVEYLSTSDPKKSLIVIQDQKTGKIITILADTKELKNDKALDAIANKVVNHENN